MRIRVITPIYNERELIPGFLRHYEKIADSILILNNNSIDGSAEIAEAHPLVELRTFTTEGYDVPAVMEALVKAKDDSQEYDWCLFPDCDELLTMRDGSSLWGYLEQADPEWDVIQATGYTLIQHPDEEPFDSRKLWFGQRKFGVADKAFDKPIMIRPRAQVRLGAGNHRLIMDTRKKGNPHIEDLRVHHDWKGVVLVHFEFVDFYLWYYRKTRRGVKKEHHDQGLAPRFDLEDKSIYHQLWEGVLKKARFLDEIVPVLRGDK